MRSIKDYETQQQFKIFCKQLQQIDSEVREYVRQIKNKNSKRAVLFLGLTGSGKTTLLNILMGIPHRYSCHEYKTEAGKTAEWVLLPSISGSEGHSPFAASSGTVSETKIPNFYQKNEMLIIDCPGFGDNRGWSQSLCNLFLIDALFKSFEGVQIIFVENRSNLTENRGNILYTNFVSLLKLFELSDMSKLEKSLSFVFTRGEEFFDSANTFFHIEDMLRGRQSTEHFSESEMNSYKNLFLSLHKKEGFLQFPKPPREESDQPEFFRKISDMVWNKIGSNSFSQLKPTRITLDDSTKLTLIEIKSKAIDHIEYLLYDFEAFMNNCEKESDPDRCIVALKLYAFFMYACEILTSENPVIPILTEENVKKFKEAYTPLIPLDIEMVNNMMSNIQRLSLFFQTFKIISIPIDSYQKQKVLDRFQTQLATKKATINKTIESTSSYLKKPLIIGGVATGGAIGSTIAIGALATTLAAAVIIPVVGGTSMIYINKKIKANKEIASRIRFDSIFLFN